LLLIAQQFRLAQDIIQRQAEYYLKNSQNNSIIKREDAEALKRLPGVPSILGPKTPVNYLLAELTDLSNINVWRLSIKALASLFRIVGGYRLAWSWARDVLDQRDVIARAFDKQTEEELIKENLVAVCQCIRTKANALERFKEVYKAIPIHGEPDFDHQKHDQIRTDPYNCWPLGAEEKPKVVVARYPQTLNNVGG
jgi:hypothetical protein